MLLDLLQGVFGILQVVLGLGLIIFIHELGHFLLAKYHKVRVEVFSLGFGQAIWKTRRGETEYRISWIPFGGYVKMAGGEYSTPGQKSEPWELTSKGAWPRAQVFAAGAIMNLLLAFPLAIITFLAGKHELSNEVGTPGVNETRAGMKPGDVIVETGGRTIESMDKYIIEMVRRPVGRAVPVKVLRDGQEVELEVKASPSSYLRLMRPPMVTLYGIKPDSPAYEAGLRDGDEVISAAGERVLRNRRLDEILRGSPGKPVKLVVRRRDAYWEEKKLEITLTPPPKEWHVIPEDEHAMECIVGGVANGTPAWEKLEPDDRIVRIDGKEIRSWQDLKDHVQGGLGKTLKVEVERKGKLLDRPLEIEPSYGGLNRVMIGIAFKPTGRFAYVAPGSYFDRAGIRTGDRLYSKDGTPGDVTLTGSDGVLGVREEAPKTINVEVVRGEEKDPVAVSLVLEKVVEGDLAALGFKTSKDGHLYSEYAQPFRRRGLGDAFMAGLHEPIDITVMTFEFLRKMIMREESVKGLSGPVGIFQASLRSAERSPGNLLWLLCVISVSLGIFNLLPIPILDGGHLVLLLIEKLRGGRPHSERFLAIFQYSGLAFILFLVVFVTFNDITRIFGGG